MMEPVDVIPARERLLRAGEQLFMAHGFAAVSTRDICTRAGVKQPTLYHYFGNKEELYLAVVERWFAQRGASIAVAIAQGTNLRERLHGIAITLWSEAAGEYQAMQRDAILNMLPEHVQKVGYIVVRTLFAPVVRLLQAAIAVNELPPHTNPVILTQIYWALVDGFSGTYRRGDRLPTPESNVAAIDFFLDGARGMTPEAYATWPQQSATSLAYFLTLFPEDAPAHRAPEEDTPHA